MQYVVHFNVTALEPIQFAAGLEFLVTFKKRSLKVHYLVHFGMQMNNVQ